jgi:hypothetical protein
MDTLAKIRKLRESNRSGNGSRKRGVFMTFEMGENIIRLVGEPIEMKNHYLGENKMAEHDKRGLITKDAEGIPILINCLDWDINIEEPKDEKRCPICKLNELAHGELTKEDNEMSDEDRGYLTDLRSRARARTVLKWNVIDRNNPNIIEQTDDGEKEVFGFKIANIGPEAWTDIEGIFNQMGFDISDPEKGIEICVEKKRGQTRVTYSVRAVLEDGAVVRTPLTDEEKQVDLQDIKKICGGQADPEKLINALQEDYKELLSVYGFGGDQSADADSETEKEEEEVVQEEESSESEEETESEPENDEPEEKQEKKEDESDASEEIDPSGWECFGTIEVDHPECQTCDACVACAKDAGVELEPAPKKKKAKKVGKG